MNFDLTKRTGGGGSLPTADDINNGLYPTGDIVLTGSTIGGAFRDNSVVTQIVITNATSIPENGFRSMSALEQVIGQKITTLNSTAMYSCPNLQRVDLLGGGNFNSWGCLGLCTKLKTLILRKADGIVAVAQAGFFQGSLSTTDPMYVYVPSALKSTYESATNWSTWVADGSIVFRDLEGSDYEQTNWWEASV